MQEGWDHLIHKRLLFLVAVDMIALSLNDHNWLDIPMTRSSYAELEQEPGFADIVIDSIPGVFYVLDSQGRFVRWNHLLEEITGLSADMLHGTDALRIIFADDRELVADKIREVFEKGMAEVDARLLGGDGLHDFWFTGRRQDIGPMSYLVGSGVDTTEHKCAEQAVRASEEQYRGLVQLSPDAILINRNNRFTFANPAALRLFGASSADQLLGKSPYDLIHPDYHETVRKRIHKLLVDGQQAVLIEEKIVRLDGTVVDVEVAASPFTDREGQGIQVILRDITERKRAEQAVLRLNEQIQIAAERSARRKKPPGTWRFSR